MRSELVKSWNGRPRRVRPSILIATCVAIATVPAGPAFAQGDTCGNRALREFAGSHLPDCRAYEQVSPTDKNGYDVAGTDTTPGAAGQSPLVLSATGDEALFGSYGAFAGFPDGGGALSANNYYLARFRDGAWSSTPATPRLSRPGNQRNILLVAPADLGASFLRPITNAFEPDPSPTSGTRFYLRDNVSGETTFLFQSANTSVNAYGGSADLSHIAFTSSDVLVTGAPASGNKAYEVTNGEVRLVSRQPGTDAPFATASAIAGQVSANDGSPAGSNGISRDGSRIFFATPASPGPNSTASLIYRRSNGTVTELASPSQRTTPDPLGSRSKVFRMATPDGNRVFFTSAEWLTDDANTGPTRAGSDLYRYDMQSNQLIDISALSDGGNGARVQGMLGTSEDGDRVYYVALGQVVPGQGTDGQRNLFYWEDDGSADGVTRYLGTLSTSDAGNWSTEGAEKTSRVTADGRFLAFQSVNSLTGYDNAGLTQVHRYDADGNGGAGELLCLSCNPDGNPPEGPSTMPFGFNLFPRHMSEDGRHVIFASGDSLLARDTNERLDAHIWSDGELSLLSTGEDSTDSRVYGMNVDGTKAFFLTREGLVPQDLDSNVDLYTATIGGGLSYQHAVPPPECAEQDCQGPGSAPPIGPQLGSSTFRGQGDVQPRPRSCATLVRRAGRARRAARRLARQVRRADGRRAVALERRRKAAVKKAKRAERRARQCERGAK